MPTVAQDVLADRGRHVWILGMRMLHRAAYYISKPPIGRTVLCLASSLRVFGSSDCRVDLLAIFPTDTWGWGTVATALARSHTDDMRMDCARDAICDFDVKLRDNVFWINTSLANITDGCTLDHVSHSETFDSLVFGDAARAV